MDVNKRSKIGLKYALGIVSSWSRSFEIDMRPRQLANTIPLLMDIQFSCYNNNYLLLLLLLLLAIAVRTIKNGQ